MKGIIIISLFLACFFFPAELFSQENLRQIRSNVTETINGKEYYIHTVKKGQSLYMISKAYNVDIDEVIRENPEVRDGLKADQKLKIPTGITEQPKKQQKKTAEEKPAPLVAEPEKELPCGEDHSKKKPVYNVALMMPLYLDDVGMMDADNLPDDPDNDYKPLRFIQFYEGLRIALDSLDRAGMKFNLYVYDVEKDSMKTKRMLKNPEFKKMDLIIGVLYNQAFHIVSDFAKQNGIPLVNPISERDQIIDNNEWVFKVKPSLTTQPAHLADFLVKNCSHDNVIIICSKQGPYRDASDQLEKECTELSLQVKEADGYYAAEENLLKDANNVLVIYAEDKVHALEVITKLNEIKNDYRFTVFGVPAWDNIEGLEADYLVNLNTHILAPYFVDYNESDVKKFVLKFQLIYKTDPDHLAFQGFDVGWYFLSALNKFGTHLYKCIPEYNVKSLQTNFQFSHSGNNGFLNQHWEIYKYENYRVKRVTVE